MVKLNTMNRFLMFSIGLSLLIGVACGNLFSITEYFGTQYQTGKKIKLSEKYYNERVENPNSLGNYFKETKFNLSIFAQSSLAIFSSLLIGYSILKKNKTQ